MATDRDLMVSKQRPMLPQPHLREM